jgi:hypothetical protein
MDNNLPSILIYFTNFGQMSTKKQQIQTIPSLTFGQYVIFWILTYFTLSNIRSLLVTHVTLTQLV